MTVDNVLTTKSRCTLGAAVRILLAAALLIVSACGTAAAAPVPTESAFHQTAIEAARPFLFVQNVGQFAPDAQFLLVQGERRLWLTEDALWLMVPDPIEAAFSGAAGSVEPAIHGRIRPRSR
jgi:hypothetical protein